MNLSPQVPEPEEEFVSPLLERLGLDQTKKGQSVLMVREAIRADHGKFTIQVENTHGVATASCVINVLGKTNIYLLSFMAIVLTIFKRKSYYIILLILLCHRQTRRTNQLHL